MVSATWKMWFYLNGAWVDLTADVLGQTHAEGGMPDNSPTTMVAKVGTLEFDMDNSGQAYSPNHANATTGWKKGVKVKQVFTFEGNEFIKWYGKIKDIDIDPGGVKANRVHVTCVDWMEYAAEHPIVNPGIQTNQTGDEVLNTVISLMPVPPLSTEFQQGTQVFPTTFDTVTSKTTAYDEIIKVTSSEVGYVYPIHDRVFGESLVFESADYRNGLRELTKFAAPLSESGFLLKATNGGHMLKSTNGGRIILNQKKSLELDNDASMLDYDIDYGKQQLNRFTVYANPRKLDAAPVVLFRLSAPVIIATGQTIIIKGSYANPDGGLPINAQDMIDPEITTDYKVWTNADETGTDITADLVVVPSYGTEGFSHAVTNNNATSGYITFFNCRGYGIYTYNPIEHTAKNQPSIDEFGTYSESINQKYKNDLTHGSLFVNRTVELENQPNTKLNRIYLTANKNASMMNAFLYLKNGDLIYCKEDQAGIEGWFYIQGYEYTTVPGGETPGGSTIMFSWIVKKAFTLACGLSMLAVEFGGYTTQDGIDFGYLPRLANLEKVSFSVWLYSTVSVMDQSHDIFAFMGGDSGLRVREKIDSAYPSAHTITFVNNAAANATWSAYASFPGNTWVNIIVTYDRSLDVYTAAPIMYVNGVSKTVTQVLGPAGPIESEVGNILVVGNIFQAADQWNRAVEGKLKEGRIYNKIISPAEALQIYNSGVPDRTKVTDGLIFRVFSVRTPELSGYVGTTLNDNMKIIDDIYGEIGTPHGAPVGRAP